MLVTKPVPRYPIEVNDSVKAKPGSMEQRILSKPTAATGGIASKFASSDRTLHRTNVRLVLQLFAHVISFLLLVPSSFVLFLFIFLFLFPLSSLPMTNKSLASMRPPEQAGGLTFGTCDFWLWSTMLSLLISPKTNTPHPSNRAS